MAQTIDSWCCQLNGIAQAIGFGGWKLIGIFRTINFRGRPRNQLLEKSNDLLPITHTIPINGWSPKSIVWTIPINKQSPKSFVWTIPINGKSPKSVAWTIPTNRLSPKSIADNHE